MTIIQPRLENISTFECSVEELLDWAETYVRPRAKLAFEGKGEQVPGDWCRFCRARLVFGHKKRPHSSFSSNCTISQIAIFCSLIK